MMFAAATVIREMDAELFWTTAGPRETVQAFLDSIKPQVDTSTPDPSKVCVSRTSNNSLDLCWLGQWRHLTHLMWPAFGLLGFVCISPGCAVRHTDFVANPQIP